MQGMQITKTLATLSLAFAIVALVVVQAADVQVNRQAQNQTRSDRKISEKCGTTEDLIYRVDYCAAPLMDILAGRLKKWPQNDNEAMALCDEFGFSERCIKDASRRCAKGLQKTIISTIGTSIQRVRKRECQRSKAGAITKTTQCIERNKGVVDKWMNSVMARLTAIETQEKSGEKKINNICCMVGDIEREIKAELDPFCPAEAKFIQRLFRGVIDSAIEIICRQPKCNDFLKNYRIVRTKDYDGLIAVILKIVFSLDSTDAD